MSERPWWAVAAPYAAAGGAVAYGALHTYWALGRHPGFGPMPAGVVAGLCAAVAVLAPLTAATARARAGALLRAAAVAAAAALAVSSCLFVLDVVALLFPGIGMPSGPASFAVRGSGLAVAAALALTALAAHRTARGACPYCGRTDRSRPHAGVPRWAFAAAYAAVAGCLVRFGAQYAIGFGTAPIGHGSPGAAVAALAFTAAMLLAGTLLPLALVHRWGRIFPRWTLFLAGRRVPRPLLAVPACFVSGGLLAYFGTDLVLLAAAAITGRPATSLPVPAAFLWTAVPAYVVWGAGLAVATASYLARTRPACARCGRGHAVDTASRTVKAALL